MKISAIEEAAQIVGSQSELARILGVSPQAVQQWVAINHVPAKRVRDIVKSTGGKITASDLRPDLWGD